MEYKEVNSKKLNMSKTQNNDLEIIYSYTSDQAEQDGILYDITRINPQWKQSIFNYITKNLLDLGYIQENKIKIANLLDLLNQSNQIVKKASKNFTEFNLFFNGKIKLPSGSKQEIFIAQNEKSKFTIMLPQDY